MVADTDAIRGLAAAFRARAEEVRDEAVRLADSAADVPWEGLAADAMRTRAEQHTDGLRRTASLHDAAAAALTLHAGEVDHAVSLLGSVANAAEDLLDAARSLPGLLR